MKLTIERSLLLKPLQHVCSSINGRPTLPILGNVLVEVSDNLLRLTATDLEVELIAEVPLDLPHSLGKVTVPARKLLDICRGLSDKSPLIIELDEQRLLIRSGRSRFSLATLPAQDFPNIEDWQSEVELELNQGELKQLVEKTQFAMANQDVRYFLNGMLFELDASQLRVVATDGHRMAMSQAPLRQSFEMKQIIIPRKGVLELAKLLDAPDEMVRLSLGQSNLRAHMGCYIFTSKLVDGRFPDYRRVLPQSANKTLTVDVDVLKQALSRAAILSNEKFRGIRLTIGADEVKVTAKNPEQEEAEESLSVDYRGEPIEIGFNVNYVLDVLNTLKTGQVRISMADANVSSLFEPVDDDSTSYVVMPIRL